MPYVKKSDRIRLDEEGDAQTPGELNYIITKTVDAYLNRTPCNYANYNEVIGVLECAKLELYRRVIAEYEDLKMAENGDVYTSEK